MLWNDPRATAPLASFTKPEPRRAASQERRADDRRATLGDRRKKLQRALRSLLKL